MFKKPKVLWAAAGAGSSDGRLGGGVTYATVLSDWGHQCWWRRGSPCSGRLTQQGWVGVRPGYRSQAGCAHASSSVSTASDVRTDGQAAEQSLAGSWAGGGFYGLRLSFQRTQWNSPWRLWALTCSLGAQPSWPGGHSWARGGMCQRRGSTEAEWWGWRNRLVGPGPWRPRVVGSWPQEEAPTKHKDLRGMGMRVGAGPKQTGPWTGWPFIH